MELLFIAFVVLVSVTLAFAAGGILGIYAGARSQVIVRRIMMQKRVEIFMDDLEATHIAEREHRRRHGDP